MKDKSKTDIITTDVVAFVAQLNDDLRELGYETILIGGMAMISLGSRRVTQDFDFIIEKAARAEKKVFGVFYKHGFELISKTDDQGRVLRTVDNQNIAWAKLNIDYPDSALFYHHKLQLQVDLLFDFPFPAKDIHKRSTQKKIDGHIFHIASKEDLIKMKEIAVKGRDFAGDHQDLEFLKKL